MHFILFLQSAFFMEKGEIETHVNEVLSYLIAES